MEFEGKNIPPELVMEFMLRVERYSLQNVCRTNRLTAAICNDEYFWRRRLEIDYGTRERVHSKTYKETWIIYPYISKVILGIRGTNNFGDRVPVTYEIPHEHLEAFKTNVKSCIDQFNASFSIGNYERINYINMEEDQNGVYNLIYYLTNNFGFPVNSDGIEYSINEFADDHYYKEGITIYDEMRDGDYGDVRVFFIPFFGEPDDE